MKLVPRPKPVSRITNWDAPRQRSGKSVAGEKYFARLRESAVATRVNIAIKLVPGCTARIEIELGGAQDHARRWFGKAVVRWLASLDAPGVRAIGISGSIISVSSHRPPREATA